MSWQREKRWRKSFVLRSVAQLGQSQSQHGLYGQTDDNGHFGTLRKKARFCHPRFGIRRSSWQSFRVMFARDSLEARPHSTRWARLIALVAALALLAAACGNDTGTAVDAADSTAEAEASDEAMEDDDEAMEDDEEAMEDDAVSADFANFDEVLEAAQGQTVQLWMWGGDSVLNDYINNTLAPAVAEQGVTLEQVRIDATSDGINRIVSEIEAGVDDGAVDLIWVNGSNFSQGKDAGLWRQDWVSLLPNSELLDPADPTLFTDFGVATDGQEVPWSRAAFTFAYDGDRVENPPTSFEELAEWVAANPGRFTYPAPPDFTGSAFVRQAVQALGEDAAFELLNGMTPNLWQEGTSFPVDEAELNQLFGNGEVDLAMSYNPNFVQVNVDQGIFADTSAPFVFESGTLQNVSFLALPANAGSAAGAIVAANVTLDATLQAEKLIQVGVPSVVDVNGELEPSPFQLTDFGTPLEELQADQVGVLDERWRGEITQ